MHLPGVEYFYALAALSMAFVGFTAIVVVLRQGTGKKMSALHQLFSSIYAELGLMASAFAMMAPTLALCGVQESLIWRICSAVMLVTIVIWFVCFPFRRKRAAPKQSLPLRFYAMAALGVAVSAALCLNIAASSFEPGPGPLAIATVYILVVASVVFLGNYSSYLRD
jgi:predicted anti-sigma-YlaC factor YlaD